MPGRVLTAYQSVAAATRTPATPKSPANSHKPVAALLAGSAVAGDGIAVVIVEVEGAMVVSAEEADISVVVLTTAPVLMVEDGNWP